MKAGRLISALVSSRVLAQKLQSAFALYKQGRLGDAEAACRAILAEDARSADAWRLLGMAASADGRQTAAREALHKALSLSPGHVEALNSLGLAAARAGDWAAAEAAYREALTRQTDYAPARRNLGGMLVSSGRCEEALALLQGVNHPDFNRLRGEALVRLDRLEEALAEFDDAARARPGDSRIAVARSRALSELGRFEDAAAALANVTGDDATVARAKNALNAGRTDEAVDALAAVLTDQPARCDALFLIAQCMWMDGRGEAIAPWFEAALRVEPARGDVIRLYARTLRQMGQIDDALAILDRIEAPEPADHVERAEILIEAERAARAHQAARAAVSAERESPSALAALARAALMDGDPETASGAVRSMREHHPLDQFWIAMEGEVMRRLDPSKWRERFADERLVGAFDLPVPGGFSSLEAFNAELAARLRRHHAFKVHPLDQSLRGGVQTSVDLRRIGDPVIDAFFRSAQSVLDEYVSGMPSDGGHPLFARKSGASEIASAWSVLLGPGGRHVSHVHPEGWISSAYYVETPGDLETRDDQEGWLVLGAPPFPVSGSGPVRAIPAKPGRLILFPSFMWHGTRPIHAGERLTIAFDVLPSQRRAS